MKNPFKNYSQPTTEVKTKKFTYSETPMVIVDADVTEYKQAFLSAHGKYIQERSKFYDIYQNALDFDTHLKGLIERRLLNTSGKVLEYIVGEQPSELAKQMTEAPVFSKLINDILMVKFWGMGLFEFEKAGEYFSYVKIPIKHVDPFAKMVRKFQYSSSKDDVLWEGLKNVVFLGDANDYGLLQQVALIAMYKRAVMSDWAQYSQLAGTNFRVVKYRGTLPSAARRFNIRDIVSNAGNGVLDLPEDIDVETSNQTSSSQNQLFENYIQYLDDQMTKLVLGQTMTTEDGSSRSQAEVHERTQESIFDADAKYVLDVLNWEMSEAFSQFGIAGGKWKYAESSTQKQMEEIERDLKLKELGVMFTNEELRLKYGL